MADHTQRGGLRIEHSEQIHQVTFDNVIEPQICKACSQEITVWSQHIRVAIGKEVKCKNSDGWDCYWYHYSCCNKHNEAPAFKSINELKGWEYLRWEYQIQIKNDLGEKIEKSDDEERREKENNDLWDLIGQLKISKEDVRSILDANRIHQITPMTIGRMIEKVADGMLFGRISPCPQCKNTGSLRYNGFGYVCEGLTSGGTPCQFKGSDGVARYKWVIPEDVKKNWFLAKWSPPASHPKRKAPNHPAKGPRTKKTEFQAQVDQIKRAIRKKTDWKHKIRNPVVQKRYVEEAVAQGASKECVEAAIEELFAYENSSDNWDLSNIASDHLIRHFDGKHNPGHLIFADLVPQTLRDKLELQLDEIANLPEKDFHPGSDGKVQDLIHPSLFPFINPAIAGPDAGSYMPPKKILSAAEAKQIVNELVDPHNQLKLQVVEKILEHTKSNQDCESLIQAGVVGALRDMLPKAVPADNTGFALSRFKFVVDIEKPAPSEQDAMDISNNNAENNSNTPAFGSTPAFGQARQTGPNALGFDTDNPEDPQTQLILSVLECFWIILCRFDQIHQKPDLRQEIHDSALPLHQWDNRIPHSIRTKAKSISNKCDHLLQSQNNFGREYEASKYQWLPAIFQVSQDNKVTIRSYINNLDRQEYPHLYETVSQVFETLWPQLNRCVRDILKTDNEGSTFKHQDLPITGTHLKVPTSNNHGNRNEPYDDLGEKYARSARDCVYADQQNESWLVNGELQVIVKACNYVLKPDQTYEGVWHVEGMSHENIVASAIYYYATSPSLQDEGLAFRVENDYDHQYGPPGQPKWASNTPLGAIRTKQGRVIMFSNLYQHKVTLLQNDGQDTATRKILCFFVVNPRKPITSSREVAPQQWEKERKKKVKILLMIAKRCHVRLPQEVVDCIMDYAKTGMTWEDALTHRKVLMEQRKYFVNELNEKLEREYSLCEH